MSMIQKFVDRLMEARPAIETTLKAEHPANYDDLVKRVIAAISVERGKDNGWDEEPDPDRLTIIDHGDYQGTRLYIIGAQGYQPSTYWSIFVNYGSCSGCDTYESIRSYSDDPPSDQQVSDYWTLMLHMVQSLRPLRGDEEAA